MAGTAGGRSSTAFVKRLSFLIRAEAVNFEWSCYDTQDLSTIRGGSGIRGLADRVEALDGRLKLESPSGGGTRLRAEIPCA